MRSWRVWRGLKLAEYDEESLAIITILVPVIKLSD